MRQRKQGIDNCVRGLCLVFEGVDEILDCLRKDDKRRIMGLHFTGSGRRAA